MVIYKRRVPYYNYTFEIGGGGMSEKVIIALEDGSVFRGRSFGARGERLGEVVFNTSMAGYQEILTDPSYRGQIVTMTYPLIGNYGVNPEDVESDRPKAEGFIVRELSGIHSNWRAAEDLSSYLEAHGIVGAQGIDTRALTRLLRVKGAMRGVISTEDASPESLVEKARRSPGLVGRDLVREVTCGAVHHPVYLGGEKEFRVAVVDTGVKTNILRCLEEVGCRLTVHPASATSAAILADDPDGIFLANGPGDPEGVPYVIDAVRDLLPTGKPIFGICLGQQILGLALGGRTYKLKFGHRGGNHPVKELATGRIDITSQNHGFCVDMDSLDPAQVELTHVNLYDNTLEGLRHRTLPVFSVQYHPEAAPGPHDAKHLFGRFADLMREQRAKGGRG
jgi:carbamoyl-phosphate synthase small subunit